MEAEHRDPAGKVIKIVTTITITSPKTIVVSWTRGLGGVVRIIKKLRRKTRGCMGHKRINSSIS